MREARHSDASCRAAETFPLSFAHFPADPRAAELVFIWNYPPPINKRRGGPAPLGHSARERRADNAERSILPACHVRHPRHHLSAILICMKGGGWGRGIIKIHTELVEILWVLKKKRTVRWTSQPGFHPWPRIKTESGVTGRNANNKWVTVRNVLVSLLPYVVVQCYMKKRVYLKIIIKKVL